MKSDWDFRPLGAVCEVLDHLRKPVTKKDRLPGPYPYYGATGIVDYVGDFLFDEPLVLIGEDGAKWGSGDATAFAITGPSWVNNHAHVVRPDRANVLDEWLVHYLVHQDLSRYVSGLTVPKLNQGSLREIPIPLPALSEQRRIVAILDEAFEGIATAKAHAERNLRNARATFESILETVYTDRVGEVPKERLEALCEQGRLITYGVIKLGDPIEGGVPCLRTSNVRWLSIDTNGMKRIAPSLSAEYSRTILRGGEVLVNVRGTLGGGRTGFHGWVECVSGGRCGTDQFPYAQS